MKLLYVVHQFFPECHSGTEQYCLAVAREARRRGHEVTILSLEPIHDRIDRPFKLIERDYDGFRVPRLRHWAGLQPNDVLRDYENPLVAARFRELAREIAPDAIHFFHLRLLGSDLLETAATDLPARTVVHLMDFWFLCPRFTLQKRDGSLCQGPPDGGKGCVECAHPELAAHDIDSAADVLVTQRGTMSGSDSASRLGALLRRPEMQLRRLAAADSVIAPSRFLAQMFVENGLPAERVTVVPYGLEPGRVGRREDVNRPRSPMRFAFAGVLSPWKAPHLCVEAMLRMPEAAATMSIWGRTEEGTFQDYIDEIRRVASVDRRIEFPGAFDETERDRVLADTDLLIVPSVWYENTPFVVLEAFAAGVPVAVSKLGGMTEIVRPGVNGFVFDAGSSTALAAVLEQCLDEPGLLRELRPEPPPEISADFERIDAHYRAKAATSDRSR